MHSEGEFIGLAKLTNVEDFEKLKKYGLHMATEGRNTLNDETKIEVKIDTPG